MVLFATFAVLDKRRSARDLVRRTSARHHRTFGLTDHEEGRPRLGRVRVHAVRVTLTAGKVKVTRPAVGDWASVREVGAYNTENKIRYNREHIFISTEICRPCQNRLSVERKERKGQALYINGCLILIVGKTHVLLLFFAGLRLL